MTVTTDPRKTGIRATASLLAASAVAVSVTGTTSETALATISIPAGAMGLNGGLHIYTTWSMTNSANTKTVRVRFSGIGGTAFLAAAVTTNASLTDFRRITNRNSAASQICSNGLGMAFNAGSSLTLITSTVDTAAGTTLVLTGQLALGTETITLENYEVWLIP